MRTNVQSISTVNPIMTKIPPKTHYFRNANGWPMIPAPNIEFVIFMNAIFIFDDPDDDDDDDDGVLWENVSIPKLDEPRWCLSSPSPSSSGIS